MKAISIIAAFVLGILVACAPSTQTTTQSGAPITPRADGKQARLAVLSFRGQNGRELSDSLNTALFRTGRFILLERESLSGLQSEASIGQKETKELAVMMDSFRPLKVARQVAAIEDASYHTSWIDAQHSMVASR